MEKTNTWFSIIVQAHNKRKQMCRVQKWKGNWTTLVGVKSGGPGRPEGLSVPGIERIDEEWHHMVKNYGQQL